MLGGVSSKGVRSVTSESVWLLSWSVRKDKFVNEPQLNLYGKHIS